MKLNRFLILGPLFLASCAVRQTDTGRQEVRFSTIEQAREGGLSQEDLSVLHAILRFAYSPETYSSDFTTRRGQREDVVGSVYQIAKKLEPRCLRISNGQGLDLGIIYSARNDIFLVVSPERLPGYDLVRFEPIRGGYAVEIVDGCVHFPFEVVTSRGKPFLLKIPEYKDG